MRRFLSFTGLAVVASAITVSAKDFPLEVVKVSGREAMMSPGGYGAYGRPTFSKPSQLKKEPAAVSAHPIYGQLQSMGSGQTHCLFRLDESRGDGKGYDRMIIDFNKNGDLTDDPVGKPAADSDTRRGAPDSYQQVMFGPIPLPAELAVGRWRPSVYAQVLIVNRQAEASRNAFIGQVLLKAANYLQATIDVGAKPERIGLMDANCDGRLGEPAKPQSMMGLREGLYFLPQDIVLRDRNGNGRFESDRFESEAEAYGTILYFDARPYGVSLAPDLQYIRLEPYPGPLGELAIQPHGEQIRNLTLAREVGTGQWEQFNPTFVAGKAKVPPGKYLVYSCQLGAEKKDGSQITAGAYNRTRRTPVTVEADKTAILRCGGPLELQVTAEKQYSDGSRGLMGAALRLFSGGSSSASEVRINMTALGAGGETYSGFVSGNDPSRMPKPVFRVLATDGRQLASGNLEFG